MARKQSIGRKNTPPLAESQYPTPDSSARLPPRRRHTIMVILSPSFTFISVNEKSINYFLNNFVDFLDFA